MKPQQQGAKLYQTMHTSYFILWAFWEQTLGARVLDLQVFNLLRNTATCLCYISYNRYIVIKKDNIEATRVKIKWQAKTLFVQSHKQQQLGSSYAWMSHIRLFIGSYLQAVDGGSGENLTCFAAWFGVHGDGTMELWEKYWNIKHEKEKLARILNYDIACIAGAWKLYGCNKEQGMQGRSKLAGLPHLAPSFLHPFYFMCLLCRLPQ